ncbi:plasmid pRiA4b ORF-3 family protein, partial [Roseovarius indicus]
MYQPANAIRLHVSLAEIDPPIWRRLVVPSDWTLDRLHLVLQAAFSWTDSHLHEF